MSQKAGAGPAHYVYHNLLWLELDLGEIFSMFSVQNRGQRDSEGKVLPALQLRPQVESDRESANSRPHGRKAGVREVELRSSRSGARSEPGPSC